MFFIFHLAAISVYGLQRTPLSAPLNFAWLELGFGVRTPQQLVRHYERLHYGLKGLQTGDAAHRGLLENPGREGDARFCETLALLEAESKPQEAELLVRVAQALRRHLKPCCK